MKFSIAMTTYNGEKYILEQLESFSHQSRLPDELVITDDGSSDKTLEIIRKFMTSSPFEIKVFRNEKNLGYTQNFNKAMQLCSHEIVFLSDQDDVWFPSKLEYMANLIVQYPDKSLFMIDTELTDENLQASGLTKQGQIKNLGMNKSAFIMGCCIAVKKSYLDLVLPIPKGFSGHDNWIVNIADILDVRHIDESIQQYYRIHGENTSTFSANRLKKAKKKKITLVQRFINWHKSSTSDVYRKYIFQKTCILTKLEEMAKEQQYHINLKEDINTIKKDINFHQKRLEIILSNNIFTRTKSAFNFYLNDGYQSFNGFKSLLSDILGD